MKRIVIAGLGLAYAWVGNAEPCSALPGTGLHPVAEAENPAVQPARHRHHYWRWHRRHWGRVQPLPVEPYPQALQGETAPPSLYAVPEAGTAEPPAPPETARTRRSPRSTRWINPDRPGR